MSDDIGRMPLPNDGPDYWADLQAWSLAALRKTQTQADRITELEAEVDALSAANDVFRRVLLLCATDNEFDVTIEHMTIWPDFNGFGTLRRALADDTEE